MAKDGSGNGNGKRRRVDMDVMEIGSFGTFGIGPEITTSADVYSDKLDLFSSVPTEGQMEYFRESRIFPVAGLTDDGPYQFHVPALSSYFLDTGSARLEGQVAIYERKADGSVGRLEADTKIIPVRKNVYCSLER